MSKAAGSGIVDVAGHSDSNATSFWYWMRSVNRRLHAPASVYPQRRTSRSLLSNTVRLALSLFSDTGVSVSTSLGSPARVGLTVLPSTSVAGLTGLTGAAPVALATATIGLRRRCLGIHLGKLCTTGCDRRDLTPPRCPDGSSRAPIARNPLPPRDTHSCNCDHFNLKLHCYETRSRLCTARWVTRAARGERSLCQKSSFLPAKRENTVQDDVTR